MAKKKKHENLICQNRKASFSYKLEDFYEAGISLSGTEVKSLRAGNATIGDGYVIPRGSELFLINVHISTYEQGNVNNHEPTRARKLLLHREEIDKILGKIKERGYTVVPTKMYFKRGVAKVSIALAKGKKHHDKRQSIKQREQKREMDRAIKKYR